MVAARSYDEVVEQLSARSVTKHFDAYADVDWDAPANAIHVDDPRFEKSDDDPLGATDWYKSQPAELRARIGLHATVHQMKVGVFFENVLSRGLLEFAAVEPDGSPAFRYAYHEVIEEGQHSLMFQEFVNRSGLHSPGVAGWERFMASQVPRMGRRFPELFFFFVLGGEAPIDFAQRRTLQRAGERHPLIERIMRIHVLEEARHICFAKQYILEHAPRLGPFKYWHLAIRVPIVLYAMAHQMLEAPRSIIRAYGIPAEVVREAYANNAEHHRQIREGLAPIVELARDSGILTAKTLPLWTRLGLVGTPADHAKIAQVTR